jgi:hypothetical protein
MRNPPRGANLVAVCKTAAAEGPECALELTQRSQAQGRCAYSRELGKNGGGWCCLSTAACCDVGRDTRSARYCQTSNKHSMVMGGVHATHHARVTALLVPILHIPVRAAKLHTRALQKSPLGTKKGGIRAAAGAVQLPSLQTARGAAAVKCQAKLRRAFPRECSSTSGSQNNHTPGGAAQPCTCNTGPAARLALPPQRAAAGGRQRGGSDTLLAPLSCPRAPIGSSSPPLPGA